MDSLEAALPDTDVLYMTRIQKERFNNAEEYAKVILFAFCFVLPIYSILMQVSLLKTGVKNSLFHYSRSKCENGSEG